LDAPKEDLTKAPPEKGVKRYFFLLGNQFWKLLGANLLMLAFSRPIVTIPAAKCGMNRVLIKLVRDGNCFVWTEFIKEFRAQVLRSLPLGILFAALLGFSYYTLSLSISNTEGPAGVIFAALGIVALFAESALASFSFVMLPMLDLPCGAILKNTAALMVRGTGRTAAAVGVKFAAILLQAALFPVGLILLIIIPASAELALCLLINPLVQEHIIAPFEERANKETIV
jgi:hypothetical protein